MSAVPLAEQTAGPKRAFGVRAAQPRRQLTEEAALAMVRGQAVLTRPGGDLEVPPEHQAIVAALQSGVVFVAIGQRSHVAVTLLYQTANRVGVGLTSEVYEVDLQVLTRLYVDEDEASSGDSETLARQRQIQELLAEASEQQASDVHIAVNRVSTAIRFRVYGRLRVHKVTDVESGRALMRALLNSATDTSSRSADQVFQQGGLGVASGRLPPSVDYVRLQYLPTSGHNGAMVARLKYRAQSSGEDLDQLGYNSRQLAEIGVMRRRTNGMYVIAGKVSSGKTTTLQRNIARMLEEKQGEISVFTIEEPVELDLPQAAQIGIADTGEAGERNARFAEAMRAALRSDPNVIVAGEVRDLETTSLAIKAALSGHALWTTTHAPDALRILDRLVDFGVERWKVSDHTIVRGLVAQRLLGRLCPGCRIAFDKARGHHLSASLAARVEEITGAVSSELYVRGPGCDWPGCVGGLIGRTVAAETVLTDSKLLELFQDQHSRQMRRYWIDQLGGQPMMFHALTKVGLGEVDVNEVEEEIDLVEAFQKAEPALVASLAGVIKGLRRPLASTAVPRSSVA